MNRKRPGRMKKTFGARPQCAKCRQCYRVFKEKNHAKRINIEWVK